MMPSIRGLIQLLSNLITPTYQVKKAIIPTATIFDFISLFSMKEIIIELDNLLLERFRWSESYEEMMFWVRFSIILEIVRRMAISYGCY